MKIKFVLFMITILLINSSLSAITTPRGTTVQDTNGSRTEFSQATINNLDTYWQNQHPNAVLEESASNTYNCHGYAWEVSEGGSNIWIGETTTSAEDVYWTDGSYNEVSSSYCSKISYSDNHSAVKSSGGYYISKWGGGPLMKHYPNDCPDGYGSPSKYYSIACDVPEEYISISTALSNAVSSQTVYVNDTSVSPSSDITVPSNITLEITSDATINLGTNDIEITTSSGTIEVESGATLTPYFSVTNSSDDILGLYPDVSSAVSDAGSGETAHIYSSSTLSSDLTVPSSVTLKFESGTTTTLNSNKITTSTGSLYMNGGSVWPDIQRKNSATIRKGFYPTIASAISEAASGDKVYLGNATYTEDVDMPGNFDLIGSSRTSTIINGDVNFDGVSSSKVSNLAVNGEIVVDGNSSSIDIHTVNAKDVIDLDLGSSHDIWNVKTESSGYIELYCTSPLVDDVDSRNSETCGITTYGSDFSADEGYYENKSSWAIYCTSSSDPELIDLEFCGNSLDIYATSGCTVDATDVMYFSDCPAPTGGSGTVNLPVTCSECPGALAKGMAGPLAADDSHINTMGGGKDAHLFYEALELYRQINAQKRADRENGVDRSPGKYASDYEAVANKMKTLLTNYPESPYAVKVLRYIDYSNRSANRATETSAILKNAEKSKSENMRLEAKRLIAADLQRQEKYAEAILVLDDLAETIKGSEDAIAHIYRKGVIYQKYLDDFDNAAACFSQVIDLDAESPIALNAQRRLDKMERDYQPGASQEENTAEEAVEFAAHNYPNPANPGTSIQYALPQDGHVSIRIYNINGQQVAELLAAEMPAGRHQVRWDGRNAVGQAAATGMYFYRVEFEDMVLTHKFLLLR
jgi:tetratricopeptide (TPR) repeat protein